MSQNITLLGASYSDVPSVELPKTGGGTAQFDDTTIASNAASASDITSGKLAFVNGELVTGTASGGGATLITKSITANGTYNASSDNADGYSSVTVNVSGGGGGGLVYETGTWTPASDVATGEISFLNTHTTEPMMAMVADEDAVATASSNTGIVYGNWNALLGKPMQNSRYASAVYSYKTSSGLSGSYLNATSSSKLNEWMTSSKLYPYTGSTSRYWRSGRTYKWIAVWAPTS